jgi:adenylate cyclase class 2
MEEFEIKFLEVNVPELEKKLLGIGARKVGEYNYSRALLDYSDGRLGEIQAWVRLRTDGKESTLTYKQRLGVNPKNISDEGMKEIEVIVADYQKTFEILKVLGLVVIREEKNKRMRYQRGDVAFDIDFWPQIPPYIEIESISLQKAKDAGRELGFNPKDGIIGTAGTVYKKYGINKDEYSLISFEKMVKK